MIIFAVYRALFNGDTNMISIYLFFDKYVYGIRVYKAIYLPD